MRLIDHFDMIQLGCTPLRARNFDQKTAAKMLLDTHPRQDVVRHLRTQFAGSGDDIGMLLFLPGLLVLSTYPHETYHLWACTPGIAPFFAHYRFPSENRYRQAPLLRLDRDGCSRLPQGVKVDVSGYLGTSTEQLAIAIFIVEDVVGEHEFSTLLNRAAPSPATILAIVPRHFSKLTADMLQPQRSFPIMWDPPLVLHYRARLSVTA
jgi:hypothetical protein